MDRPNYEIPQNPTYNPDVPKILNEDLVLADGALGNTLSRMIENTHALREHLDDALLGILPLKRRGTGATNAVAARNALGLNMEVGLWDPVGENLELNSISVRHFTRIGNLVLINFWGNVARTGTSNILRIGGLPFVAQTHSAGSAGTTFGIHDPSINVRANGNSLYLGGVNQNNLPTLMSNLTLSVIYRIT